MFQDNNLLYIFCSQICCLFPERISNNFTVVRLVTWPLSGSKAGFECFSMELVYSLDYTRRPGQ